MWRGISCRRGSEQPWGSRGEMRNFVVHSSFDVPECTLQMCPIPFCWRWKVSSVVLCCELEVWTYLRCPDEHSNHFAVDVMSIWIQRWILLCWRSPQRWCRCRIVVEAHVLQHAVVVRPFQSDCDVAVRTSADALSQEAKWLLRSRNCRVFEAERFVEVPP